MYFSRLFLSLFCCFLIQFSGFSAWAVVVPQQPEAYIERMRELRVGITEHSFRGALELEVRYLRLKSTINGRRGALVLVPGRTEPAWKFVELMRDFEKKGFSSIYVIDHRGQGNSERRFSGDRGHVDSFKFYSDDLAFLIHRIVRPENEGEKVFLIAHSMGGAVAAQYLSYGKSLVHRAVLSTPMIEIQLPENLDEFSLLVQTTFACLLPKALAGEICHGYAPSTGAFSWDKWEFKDNRVTTSPARFAFLRQLMQENPQMRVGGPTLKWIQTSIRHTRELRSKAPLIGTPILMFLSGREHFVENKGAKEFCAKAKDCRLVEFPEALHEIFHERDEIRNRAVLLVDQFLI